MRQKAYSIVILPSVFKDIRRTPRQIALRLDDRIKALAENPFPAGSQKIHGYDNYYRVRIGQYRIVYEVATEIRIITIIRVGHRKDVYRVF